MAEQRLKNKPILPHGEKVLFMKSENPPFGGFAGPETSGSTRFAEASALGPDFHQNPAATATTRMDRPAEATINLFGFFDLVKALGPGERWITVRSHGDAEKGTPILIKQQPDGSAKVIGGAGGKLNHLKLTGVRSEADYKADALKRSKDNAFKKKEQARADKEAGLTEVKKANKADIKAQVGEHRAKFVQTVAQALGWKNEDLAFPEHLYQNVSEPARKQAEKKHANEVFSRAKEAVDQQRQMLVQDAEARSAAGLGEVPLTSAMPDQISVQDLDPITPATKGLGYSTDYAKRAEAAGATKEDIKAEATAAKPPPAKLPVEGRPTPAETRKEVGEKIKDELVAIRDPGPKVDPKVVVDVKKAVELLKAEKNLKAVEKAAREKTAAVTTATAVEPQAYVLEVGKGAVDADVVKDLENDLRTLRTKAFLSEVGKIAGGTDAIGRHVGVGAYNSINALSLAAGGSAMVDRSVVDVLGIAGAAQVLARRLHTDMTPAELDNIKAAMGSFHVDHYMETSDSALRQARDWHEAANEIEIGEAATGSELAQAQELNAKRRDLINKANTVLGTAYGEMEANAALVMALDQPDKKNLQVSMGKTGIETAIQQLRAIGLQRGDYQIEKVGASTMLTVTGAGMDRLAKPVAREDLERVKGALDIIDGHQDEDNWLPLGVSSRPELSMTTPAGVAPRLAKPFKAGPDIGQSIRDYIGGRTADGDTPADVLGDLLSEDTMQKAGDRTAFMAALNEIAPITDEAGKQVRVESHAAAFEKMADDYVAGLGGDKQPLHRQKFDVDQTSVDALHSALAEHPEGVVAFKPIGDLTPQDQAALRNEFVREHGKVDPAVAAMHADMTKLDGAEPEKEVDDMFGRGVNPEHTAWKAKRDALAAQINGATMTWSKYLDVMGKPQAAYAAMQDCIKSRVLRSFADHHNKLRASSPLKVGRTVIANDLNHLDAVDPAARETRIAEHRGLVDRLRNRAGGKYASGSVSDKIDAARAAEEADSQNQMNMFGASDDLFGGAKDEPAKATPRIGERYTIGHQAERQIAGMMPIVGQNFKPGQPTKLWQPTMSGKYVGRQRAVKLIEHNKKTVLGLGVGSGKTSISLSGFTNLHGKGKAHRGLFLVPSVVQGQFQDEAITLLEPGKFKWHCNPGAARAERIAAYKDKSNHFNVVTHQAFRDDMLHLAAERENLNPDAVADKLDRMTPAARQTYMKELMAAEGIDHDYLAVDEGHNLLNRAGKKNSNMANVIDGISHGMNYSVSMSADPIKNDPSEAFDILSKMDPERYSDRDAFMRKYGVNTASSKDELRREMARHFYTGKIDPGVKAEKKEISVALDDQQKASLTAIDKASAKARLARMKGDVDVDAMRTLSPGSFAGIDPAQHGDIAKNLTPHIGILRNTAVGHTVNGGAKTETLARIAKDRSGKPGVVFVHSLDRVDEVVARLQKDGHRVCQLTGKDSSADKDKVKREFQAGKHDIIVCSDAGAVGANLQRGQWLAQYDTPNTAMGHAQRAGRINRVGQKNNVELIDLIADHASERQNRDRLSKKYELRDIMSSPLDGLDDHGIAGYINRVRSGQQQEAQKHFAPTETDVPEAPDEQQSMF